MAVLLYHMCHSQIIMCEPFSGDEHVLFCLHNNMTTKDGIIGMRNLSKTAKHRIAGGALPKAAKAIDERFTTEMGKAKDKKACLERLAKVTSHAELGRLPKDRCAPNQRKFWSASLSAAIKGLAQRVAPKAKKSTK